MLYRTDSTLHELQEKREEKNGDDTRSSGGGEDRPKWENVSTSPFNSQHFSGHPIIPSLSVDISDDVADALRLPPDEAEQEVRKELAVTLYARQLLPLGKARKLAGLSRRDFETLLGERQVPRHYSGEDLEAGLDYAFGDARGQKEADDCR